MINTKLVFPKLQSNPLKRTLTGISLITYMLIVMYYGPPIIYSQVLLIQIKCFDEIIQIAYKIKNYSNVSQFRKINWYLLFTANYFLSGKIVFEHMKVFYNKYYFFNILVHYHKFITFCLYFFGLLWFLTLIEKKQMRRQFELLFWTHFLIIIIVWQSYMFIFNFFDGIIWTMLPLGLVIMNDIFAYLFGKLFGKSPLISVSPNKTWEGFLLGGASTIILGPVLAYLFSRMNYLICPVEYIEVNDRIVLNTNCTRHYIYHIQKYDIANTGYYISTYPLFLHTIALAIFASMIAPFGGFFASGFKRAVGIKDFGEFFPGHGGLLDRFDCQFLMGTFARVYIKTFIMSQSVDKVFQSILSLNDENQLEFFRLLQDSLKELKFDNGTNLIQL